MFFKQETVRRKKRFIGDLRSWMNRHDLNRSDAERIIGAGQGSVSGWLNGKATPQLSSVDAYREKMHSYDDQHAPPPGLSQPTSEKKSKDGAIHLSIAGPSLQFSCDITIAQAASILASVAQK